MQPLVHTALHPSSTAGKRVEASTTFPTSHPSMQRLIHTGLVPAMYRYQALAKALKRSADDDEDEDEAPLEDTA